MTTRVTLLAALYLAVCAGNGLARTWTDSTGKFKIEAELVDVEDGKVRLKKDDGSIVTVPLIKLSAGDRAFLRRRMREERDEAPRELPPTVNNRMLTGKSQELANDDGKPAGQKSFPRGHASAFVAPEGTWYLTSVRLHGARYGHPMPPREDFHITLCNEDFEQIADFTFPYGTFQRGEPRWVALPITPTKVPAKFVICAGFNAERTKGVYVSHDEEGTSLVGLPGNPSGQFTGGDWMIRVTLDKVKATFSRDRR
jgi:hypothetical protein